jgi:hypothetical protein
MSSTNFTTAVTTIPAAWANDVNRVIYDVLGAPSTLAQLQNALGLGPVLNGGALRIINGSVEGSAIGATQPSTGVFTRVQIAGNNSGLNDVVTHAQLTAAVAGATNLIEDMAYQSATSVDITGGTLDGVIIGSAVPGPGRFTTLKAQDPVSGTDVVNMQTLDVLWDTLPSFGSMASQNKTSVDINGGYIDGTVIGASEPAEAAFTRINTDQILGSTCHVFLDGAAPGLGQYALLFDLISNASLDLGFRLKDGAAVEFISPNGKLAFQDGRVVINTTDNGIHTFQVGGTASIGEVFLGNITPAAANSVVSKSWVDTQLLTVRNSIAPAIAAAIANLGDMITQNQTAISVSGGSIDGVVIGGLVPGIGNFTQANTNVVLGSHGMLRLDGSGGYANSAAIISAADSTRPNISVVPNANGAFAVMAGGVPVHRTHVNGRTVIGAGGEDGLNTLQVYGDAVVHGRFTLDGGTMTGTVSAGLGVTAPALMTPNAPRWVRVRVNTPSGLRECVMPAWEVM